MLPAQQLSLFSVPSQIPTNIVDFPLNSDQISPFPQSRQFPLTALIAPISPLSLFQPEEENLTSNGRRKASVTDPLRSYSDYKLMSDHFLSKGQIRNFCLLVIGISTGLRVSDLVSLRIGHIFTTDNNGNPIFREYIDINEKKTGKRTVNKDDAVLITESVKQAVMLLLQDYATSSPRSKKEKKLNLDDWLFQSKQAVKNEFEEDDDGNPIPNPMYGQYVLSGSSVHRIMKDAERELGLPLNIGSHTLRKTFACLAYAIAKKNSSNDAAALEAVEILLRHGDVKKTLRYLKITKAHSDFIRNKISDFLLGKSEITSIQI